MLGLVCVILCTVSMASQPLLFHSLLSSQVASGCKNCGLWVFSAPVFCPWTVPLQSGQAPLLGEYPCDLSYCTHGPHGVLPWQGQRALQCVLATRHNVIIIIVVVTI